MLENRTAGVFPQVHHNKVIFCLFCKFHGSCIGYEWVVRTIHTLILRLFIDSDQPAVLRGALYALGDRAEPLPFQDEEALLVYLKRLAADPLPVDPGDTNERKRSK